MTTFRDLPQALEPYKTKHWWMVWRFIPNRKGKLTKVPYQAKAPNTKAKCDDPRNLGRFCHRARDLSHR